MASEFSAEQVLALYNTLEDRGISIWIDGGWAVDALAGRQTRPHTDIDVAVEYKNLDHLKDFLKEQGCIEIDRDEDKKWDSVYAYPDGREVDIHAFSFDAFGAIVPEHYWNGYGPDALSGKGVIGGQVVRCATIAHLLKTHDINHRPLQEKDYHDLKLLRR